MIFGYRVARPWWALAAYTMWLHFFLPIIKFMSNSKPMLLVRGRLFPWGLFCHASFAYRMWLRWMCPDHRNLCVFAFVLIPYFWVCSSIVEPYIFLKIFLSKHLSLSSVVFISVQVLLPHNNIDHIIVLYISILDYLEMCFNLHTYFCSNASKGTRDCCKNCV